MGGGSRKIPGTLANENEQGLEQLARPLQVVNLSTNPPPRAEVHPNIPVGAKFESCLEPKKGQEQVSLFPRHGQNSIRVTGPVQGTNTGREFSVNLEEKHGGVSRKRGSTHVDIDSRGDSHPEDIGMGISDSRIIGASGNMIITSKLMYHGVGHHLADNGMGTRSYKRIIGASGNLIIISGYS